MPKPSVVIPSVQKRERPLYGAFERLVASGGPIREANQDARSAPRRGENRLEAIRINRTTDTRIFSERIS